MPVYPYRCSACDHEWDSEHGINDPVETTCPSCGAESAVRQIGGGQTIDFRGEGWTPRFGQYYRHMKQAQEMIDGTSKNPGMIHGRDE